MAQKDLGADLTRSGLRSTQRRRAILGILEQSSQPLAADDIFLALKQNDISANLSTVYRTLEALAEKKLVNKLTIAGDSRTLFELNRPVHRHYLVCLDCKRIQPISGCPLKEYEQSLARETRYAIAGHQLDVYGYCPDCLGKREKSKAK